MSTQPDPKQPSLTRKQVVLLVGIALVVLVWIGISTSQQQNQIVRPVPNGPPAPVIPQLPDLTADLRRAKSLCEGQAIQVKGMASAGRVRRGDLDEGHQLYNAARADYDGCIDYLCTGLDRRFNDDDPAKIERRMREANDKLKAFCQWADRQIQPGQVGALGPLGEGLDELRAWLRDVAKENQQAITDIKARLEKCRLQEWELLGN